MAERRRYKNPPIEEALCEFRFAPGQDWDPTIPGKLQTKLCDAYSGKAREQKTVQVGFGIQDGKPFNLQYSEGLERVQLVTNNGKRMVGVGPDVISVHMLRPYQQPDCPGSSGWDEFKRRISAALDAYWQVVESGGVRRIGIRYTNKIIIPSTARVEEYLKCAAFEIDGLPGDYSNFMSRAEYSYPDKERLILSCGLISAPPEHMALLLDFDVIWENAEPVPKEKALKMANDLRTWEREAFEAVITDKTRELFDAD